MNKSQSLHSLQTLLSVAEFGLINLNQRLRGVASHPVDFVGNGIAPDRTTGTLSTSNAMTGICSDRMTAVLGNSDGLNSSGPTTSNRDNNERDKDNRGERERERGGVNTHVDNLRQDASQKGGNTGFSSSNFSNNDMLESAQGLGLVELTYIIEGRLLQVYEMISKG